MSHQGGEMNRKEFLKGSLLMSAAWAGTSLLAPQLWASFTPKRVLILGGTSFVGPAVVNAMVADGHSVTLFNRGVTNPELFPHLEKLRGFRSSDANNQDLSALSHRHFDVIVDVWPNDPDMVASAADFLKQRTQHYVFISSIAAYDSKEFAKTNIEEDAPMEPWNGPGRTYDRNKA